MNEFGGTRLKLPLASLLDQQITKLGEDSVAQFQSVLASASEQKGIGNFAARMLQIIEQTGKRKNALGFVSPSTDISGQRRAAAEDVVIVGTELCFQSDFDHAVEVLLSNNKSMPMANFRAAERLYCLPYFGANEVKLHGLCLSDFIDIKKHSPVMIFGYLVDLVSYLSRLKDSTNEDDRNKVLDEVVRANSELFKGLDAYPEFCRYLCETALYRSIGTILANDADLDKYNQGDLQAPVRSGRQLKTNLQRAMEIVHDILFQVKPLKPGSKQVYIYNEIIDRLTAQCYSDGSLPNYLVDALLIRENPQENFRLAERLTKSHNAALYRQIQQLIIEDMGYPLISLDEINDFFPAGFERSGSEEEYRAIAIKLKIFMAGQGQDLSELTTLDPGQIDGWPQEIADRPSEIGIKISAGNKRGLDIGMIFFDHETEEEVPLLLKLSFGNKGLVHMDWNVLEDPNWPESRKLHDYMMVLADRVISHLSKTQTTASVPAVQTTTTQATTSLKLTEDVLPGHYRDPIYDLRREMRNHDHHIVHPAANTTADIQPEDSKLSPQIATDGQTNLEVIMAELPENMRSRLWEMISLFNNTSLGEPLPGNFRKLRKLSPDKQELWRLKLGEWRIILIKKDGSYYIYDIGNRKDVYRKLQIA